MTDFLFKEFDSVSSAAWKQKIQADLKGADYNDTLLWNTNEGITVNPIYHKDQQNDNVTIPLNSWKIAQQIAVTDVNSANKKAIEAIEKGAESIIFKIEEVIDISQLLKNIDTDTIELQFQFIALHKESISQLLALKLPKCFINLDIIGNLAKTGNWYHSLEEDHQFIQELLQQFPQAAILSIDTSIYQNAGANITQQLAYAIAHLNEYFNHFKDQELPRIQFITAIGGNYFFEIAKIRALKLLYQTLASEYTTNYTPCTILSFPSNRNKTIYDYNVNMLRTTTESMSAVLGGANTVCNLPYDHIYHHANEFGDRIARNQLLVLKNESAFDLVANPADGAYYIENITQQLAERALAIFKQIEQGGGFLSQLKEGTIQRKIKESAQKEQEQFSSGELVLLGTNKYPNEKDKMAHDLEKQPFLTKTSRKTLIAPIVAKRLSEASDKLRLDNE